MCNPPRYCFSDSFQLDSLSALFGVESFLLRIPHIHSFEGSPLKHYQPVNMDTGICTCRPLLSRFADHPSYFTMPHCTDSISCKSKIRSQRKITFDFFIDKMKFIPVKPDIGASSRKIIGL